MTILGEGDKLQTYMKNMDPGRHEVFQVLPTFYFEIWIYKVISSPVHSAFVWCVWVLL